MRSCFGADKLVFRLSSCNSTVRSTRLWSRIAKTTSSQSTWKPQGYLVFDCVPVFYCTLIIIKWHIFSNKDKNKREANLFFFEGVKHCYNFTRYFLPSQDFHLNSCLTHELTCFVIEILIGFFHGINLGWTYILQCFLLNQWIIMLKSCKPL